MNRSFEAEQRSEIGNQVRTLFAAIGLVLCLLGGLFPPATVHAQTGFTFPLTETFKTASASNWQFGGTATLTSNNGDPQNNGWLRLTDNTTYKAGYAYYKTAIPTGRGLIITFDYGAWGGSGADGLTFYLFDGATATFNVGASGGSLGYAQKSGVNGLSGGYLGLGLDEFGNYSNPNEGRSGGPGLIPHAVAIRGPGAGTTGYAYLAGTTNLTKAPWSLPRIDCPTNYGSCGGSGAGRPVDTYYYRQVQITVKPIGAAYQVAVAMKFSKSATSWTPLFGPFTMPTSAPGTLKMGFAASTGGSTNYHEIRNLSVTQQVPDLTATKAIQNFTTGGGSVAPGDELLYTVVLNNRTNAAISSVRFTDTIPANTTYVANSIAVPSGATLIATNPISVTNITIPANGQATITFKVRVVNPIAVGVTQISNQGAYIYGATTTFTDGDTQTEGNQATTIWVTAGPNFDTSTKTVTYEDLNSDGAVSPGDRLTYHVILPNMGNQNSPTTSFVDVLPSNTTYVANSAIFSGGTASYNSTTKTLGWTVGVNAGSLATLDFKVTVNIGVKIRDVISNQGTTTYGTTSVLTDADLATPGKQPTQLLAGGGATLAATKSAAVDGGGALQPGGRVRYTIRLTNTGSYSITGATFADTIPANTTYVSHSTDKGIASFSAPALSVTGINLTTGVTATIQLTVQLNSPLSGVTQISNQGLASYDSNQGGANNATLQTDGNPTIAGQQPTYTDISNTDLAITKTLAYSNPAETDAVIYTVRVTNQGPESAAAVTVSDPLPAGLSYGSSSATAGSYTNPTWTVGTLASGASATLTLNASATLGQGGNRIDNTASVSSALYDANPANNTASASLTVKTTTLSGILADARTGTLLEGVSVDVTDSLGNHCTAITDSGGSYTVTSGHNGCLLAPGAVTVAATGGAPVGYLLRSSATTVTAGTANTGNLTLVRPSLSGFVTDLGSGVALIDASVTFAQGATECTTHTGAGGAYSFEAGSTCNFTAGAATVAATQTGYQLATATPTILSTGPTTQDVALGTADLLITKSDDRSVVQPGDLLDYALTVMNQGSVVATGIVVTDTLPTYLQYVSDDAGVAPTNPTSGVYVWTLADLAPGATKTFTLQARVAISLPDGTTSLQNYANLTATSADRDRTNNEVSDVDTVVAHPDLTLFKSATADSSPIVAGGTITYTCIGDNRGTAIATGVRITDTLDANTTYVADSAVLVVGEDTWPLITTYSSDLHRLLLDLPTLPPGAEGYLRYKVTVADPLPEGTALIANTAEVTSNELDLDLLDNRSTVVLGAQPGADFYVQKVALPDTIPALPGGQMLYRLRYGNLRMGTATSTVLTDVTPAHTSYVANSLYLDGEQLTDAAGDDEGQYVSGSRQINVNLGNLGSGITGVVTFTVRIDDVLPAGLANIDNTAFITAAVSDPALGNNQSTAAMEVAAQPDLTITKSDGRTQVQAGDLLTYTIAYSNTGNQAATGVKITDTLLAGIDYVESNPMGSYNAGTATITWDIGALPVNEMRTATVTGRVKIDVQSATVVANRVTIADDGANGLDINPAGNTYTDSDLVIAPYIKLEKHASGPAYVGQPVTYTVEGYNSQYATAYNVVVTDILPANTTLVEGSITGGGMESDGVITWDMGDVEPGRTGALSFAVIPNADAGHAAQTQATLSTEDLSGRLTLTSSTVAPATGSRPWCDFDACAAFKGIYQGEDGTPPTGWNDNPRLTQFNDTSWSQPQASSTVEFIYWADPASLDAEWVAIHTISETVGNFTFFRQPFCLPLNATGLTANIEAAGDDVSDIYLNGVYLGQEVGAGAADSFDANSGIQSGVNLLSVQLLNNRHGGHDVLDGHDHSGLLFNLGASFTGVRPFASAPATILAGQTATFTVDELALGGRKPYSYTLDYGDNSSVAAYQFATAFAHQYDTPGVYTATVTARAQYGCTGSDQVVITVLPASANLLANPVNATYQDANSHLYAAASGAGSNLLPAADLSIVKTLASGPRVPGQAITYQIIVANQGPNNVTGATILDALPAAITNVTWTCSPGAGASCTSSGSGNLADTANIPAGSTIVYTVIGTIAAGATGSLANTATVAPAGDVIDLVPTNNTSTDTGSLTPQVNLSVSNTSSPNPGLAPGREVGYVVRVSNSGPSDAVAISIADTFPTVVTGVTWTCTASESSACTASGSGDLADTVTIQAGGSITYTVVANIDPEAGVGTVIVNTATATYAGGPVSGVDNNTLVASTSLAATKEALNSENTSSRATPFIDADSNGGISPGDTLKYKVVITNDAYTAYNVLLNDELDANTTLVVGSVTCDVGCAIVQGNTPGDTAVSVRIATLAASNAATIYYRVQVKSSLPFQMTTLANQGYAASSNAAAIATDDPATVDASDATVVTLKMGSIQGDAWVDDGDGVKEAGEPVIPEVAVTLYYAGPNDQTLSTSAHTNAAGAYTFSVLAAGSYQVGFDLREGFSYSPEWGAEKDTKVDPATGLTAVINLGAIEQRTGVSSGQLSALEYGYLPASFANTTLAQDGARHIVPSTAGDRLYMGTGIAVSLDGVESATASGSGNGVVRPLNTVWTPGASGTLTVTASGGGTLWGWFDWDRNGQFGSGEAQELGTVVVGIQSVAVAVSPSDSATNALFARFRLYPEGYSDPVADRGIVSNGEVEDYAWYAIRGVVFDDINGNGLQDTSDVGHAGLTVTLKDTGNAVLGATQTAADGSYLVTGVTSGAYKVALTVPSNYVAITPSQVDLTVSGTPELQNFAVQYDSQPTDVDLVSFDAAYENDALHVTWVATWDPDTLGFHLYRSEADNFESAVQISQGLILVPDADGADDLYRDYAFTDTTVAPNHSYWYWLMEVKLSGATNVLGPLHVTTPPDDAPDWAGHCFLPLITTLPALDADQQTTVSAPTALPGTEASQQDLEGLGPPHPHYLPLVTR